MNEDWLNKIRDRMADYEIDEPDGLWTAIENRRQAPASGHGRPGRNVILAWVRRSAAAAVLAAVGLLCFYVMKDAGNFAEPPSSPVVAERVCPPAGVETPAQAAATSGKTCAVGKPGLRCAGEIRKTCAESVAAETVVRDSLQEGGREQKDTMPVTKETTYGMQLQERTYHIASIAPQNRPAGKISCSMFASGGAGSVLNRHYAGEIAAGSIGVDNAVWKDDPMLGILLFNRGQDIDTDVRHRFPVRAGVTVSYSLSDRFAVESGLSYTNLTSDIREGSENHYYAGQQRLHYIGMPLNLKYRILSWRRLDVYASSGILVEKCVSAKIDKEYVISHQGVGRGKEDIRDKPLQLSVGCAAGVQYNLVNLLGVYVEPGMNYYFNDGSPLQTIYKEKPLNFNFNIGLRLTFGK